jgi:hypothetical protein
MVNEKEFWGRLLKKQLDVAGVPVCQNSQKWWDSGLKTRPFSVNRGSLQEFGSIVNISSQRTC